MSESEIHVIEPRGRLDALGARDLWLELEPLTQNTGTRLIVDMAETRYLSSEGIRVLLRAKRVAEENGGHMSLCCLNARLLEILAMAGLEKVFDIHPTRAAAQRALESR